MPLKLTGRLYTTLALFLKSSTQKETQLTAATYVQKSIEYISANYSYPITVEDIAAYVGLSRSHLFRSFELVLQQSPKEYLTDFRMKTGHAICWEHFQIFRSPPLQIHDKLWSLFLMKGF